MEEVTKAGVLLATYASQAQLGGDGMTTSKSHRAGAWELRSSLDDRLPDPGVEDPGLTQLVDRAWSIHNSPVYPHHKGRRP